MKAKKIVALILSLILILSLAACDLDVIRPDGSVYWLNFKPELDATLQELAAQYTESSGVDVRVVTPGSGTYQQALEEALDSDDPPTMFVINNQQGAEEWGGYALDLSDTDIQKQLDTSKSTTVSALYNEAGALVALPYCQECFGIAVNPSLIENLDYSVEDIQNFDDLKEIAELIHNNASWLGYDAFCSPDLDADSAWRITGHMANLEYVYEQRDSGSWGVAAPSLTGAHLSEFKNLYDLCINNAVSAPGELAKGGHDPFNEFKEGKAAFFLTGSWDYAALKESIPDVTIIPYYCGVKGEEKAGLNSGTENYWAINADVSQASQKETMAFMCWLVTDADASAKLAEQLGYLPYKKAARSDNGFLAVQNKYVEEERYSMEWLMKFQPDSEVYRAGLVQALTAYNADQSDENWEKFRAAFVDDWAKLYVEVYNR